MVGSIRWLRSDRRQRGDQLAARPQRQLALAGGCTDLTLQSAAKLDDLVDILNARTEMPTFSDLSLAELKRLKREYDRRRRPVRRE